MDLNTNTKKLKKLKHVEVYDRLYALIQNGSFAVGSQLPSEPELSAQMKVSRMTLRKALALLQEDGFIQNIRGKGNFVKNPDDLILSDDRKSARHPVYQCCTEILDNVEIEMQIEPPTAAVAQALQRKSPAIVNIDLWYKHGNTPCAYSLTFLPIEIISEEDLDLNYPDKILNFLEQELYQKAVMCHCSYSHSIAGNFTASKYKLSEQASFLLIQETVYGKDQKIIASTKHYIPIDMFKLETTIYQSEQA